MVGNVLPDIFSFIQRTKFGSEYHFRVPHVYWLGGFDLSEGTGISFDELGLNWVRTIVLSSKHYNIKYEMVNPEDLKELVGHDFPSDEQVIALYGKPVAYEDLRNFRK